MEDTQLPKGMNELIFATLLGTGELSYYQGIYQCMFILEKDRYSILDRYIQHYDLDDYVIDKRKRGQFFIQVPGSFSSVYESWYDQYDKKKINPQDINKYIGLLAILLFGERKISPIELRSTIYKRYHHAAAYYFEKLFNVFVEPSMNGFNIHQPIELFLEATKYFSLEDTSEFASFLTNQESKQLSQKLNPIKEYVV